MQKCVLFGRPPLLAQCVDLDVRLYYAAVQNMVYGVRMFHRPLLKVVTRHRCGKMLLSEYKKV